MFQNLGGSQEPDIHVHKQKEQQNNTSLFHQDSTRHFLDTSVISRNAVLPRQSTFLDVSAIFRNSELHQTYFSLILSLSCNVRMSCFCSFLCFGCFYVCLRFAIFRVFVNQSLVPNGGGIMWRVCRIAKCCEPCQPGLCNLFRAWVNFLTEHTVICRK